MVYTAPASQKRRVIPTLPVPLITVAGELKMPVPQVHELVSVVSVGCSKQEVPITRFTTRAITDQYPKRNRSSGVFVMIVLGMFSGNISNMAEFILLSSSRNTSSVLDSVNWSAVETMIATIETVHGLRVC